MRRDAIREMMLKLEYALHRENGEHLIWRHPRARCLVATSKTASDWRAVKNAFAVARRMLREGSTKLISK